MQLIETLSKVLAQEESLFRAQLLREDLERLRRLAALAEAAESRETFAREGAMIGWTPNDSRTHELKSALDPLLDAIYEACRAGRPDPERDARVAEAWRSFDALRMERLVGCLTRVPKPDPE